MKRLILVLVLVGTLLFAGTWWHWVPDEPGIATQAEVDFSVPPMGLDEPVPADPEAADLEEQDLDDWQGPRSRRLVHVPAGERRAPAAAGHYDDIDAITPDELGDFARHNLKRGLEGDLHAANRVIHAQRRCQRAPRTPAEIERQVREQMRRYEWRNNNWPSNAPTPNTDDIRAGLVEQFENCRFMAELFTPDLREQLRALAERGEVTARYLYALLPPELDGRSDAFLRQQEWAERALTFSLANLTEGEVAGLLAFGQSYANRGMFTTTDRRMGTAFIIAAVDCGLNLDYYANYVEQFLNPEQFMGFDEQDRAQVLVMADGLRGFCR